MSSVIIEGGNPLNGEVCIQGSKNAVLPILAATVLTDGMTKLQGCPRILDVDCMLTMLEKLGCQTSFAENVLTIDTTDAELVCFAEKETEKTRASVLLLGAMLGRFHKAVLSFPGGCTIGTRPVDLHLSALRKMGAVIETKDGILCCYANRLSGAEISLTFPSVGATENIILAAVLADGVTRISNAAREPEICALCSFLRLAGAKIAGDGTRQIFIEGVKRLNAVNYRLPYDRIVAGTYLTAVAAAGGDAVLCGVVEEEQKALLEVLKVCGCKLRLEEEVCCITRKGRLTGTNIITEPYPGFPTDMQSQILSMLTLAEGQSRIKEQIFENRFQNKEELLRMGAKLFVDGRTITIKGVEALSGMQVKATDLRGGAGLCIAGLMAEGTTMVSGMEYVERGYEDIVRDLSDLGAKIAWTVEEKKQK